MLFNFTLRDAALSKLKMFTIHFARRFLACCVKMFRFFSNKEGKQNIIIFNTNFLPCFAANRAFLEEVQYQEKQS